MWFNVGEFLEIKFKIGQALADLLKNCLKGAQKAKRLRVISVKNKIPEEAH